MPSTRGPGSRSVVKIVSRERLKAEAGAGLAPQITRAFALVFARKPSPEEFDAAITVAQSHGMTQLCRMLLNANEFVYVE